MNLVLIGYRGAGKSEAAQRAGELLRRAVVTMDRELERRFGCTISEYVAAHGWEAFRGEEAALVRELSARDRLIIDTGGGVVEREENVAALRANGRLIWLTADPSVIAERLSGATDRPSLSGEQSFLEEISEVLERRRPLYNAAADAIIDTDHREPYDIAREVVSVWRALNEDAAPGAGSQRNH